MLNIKCLKTDPVFAEAIKKLAENFNPTEEDLIQVEKEIASFMNN